jgi:hypothetical protein
MNEVLGALDDERGAPCQWQCRLSYRKRIKVSVGTYSNYYVTAQYAVGFSAQILTGSVTRYTARATRVLSRIRMCMYVAMHILIDIKYTIFFRDVP